MLNQLFIGRKQIDSFDNMKSTIISQDYQCMHINDNLSIEIK